MKHKTKALAACMSGILALTSVPLSAGVNAADGSIVYSTDFEDGDVSAFTNRGENDTTVLSASTEEAVSGTTSLLASGRSKDWNGPAFRLDDKCEPYTEYYVSAKIKGRYYTNATLSFQFNNADGVTEYRNLVQNLNGSDWQTVENVKVSFTDDMTDVYVYFEGGQDDLFIDDFSVIKVPETPIETDIPALKDVYAEAFKIGTAITADNLSSGSFMSLVERHFSGSITVGNEMKPDSVLDSAATLAYVAETGDDTNPQVSFSKAKGILNYCQKNNIPVRVHTLVWHSQTPDWFFKEGFAEDGDWVSSEKMLKRMENYIKNYFTTLTALYPDVDFYACDVVNEAWMEDGTPRQPGEQGSSGSSKSAWVQVFGDNSFIEYAFTYAREYAPKGCKLYYNDYNEYMQGKMDAIVAMATDLKAKGLIDGIGMQSHLDARQSLDAAFPSISAYNKALDTYAALGLDIQVTELDATIPEQDSEQYYDVQAEYYSGIMDAIYAHRDSVSAVIFWGVTDDQSWRANQLPLLFDAEYKAKPAFYSIIDDIEYTTTEPTATTTAETETSTESGTVTQGKRGDVDCNGEVAIADAVLLSRLVAEDATAEVSAQGKINAELDGVTGITAEDTIVLLKALSGIISLED